MIAVRIQRTTLFLLILQCCCILPSKGWILMSLSQLRRRLEISEPEFIQPMTTSAPAPAFVDPSSSGSSSSSSSTALNDAAGDVLGDDNISGHHNDDQNNINGAAEQQLQASPSNISPPPPLAIHHIALKTRNLPIAEQFYSLLGYKMTEQFRAGPAKAAWLELEQQPAVSGTRNNDETTGVVTSRLEFLEVPGHILLETPGTKKQSFDMMQRAELLGYHHVALDVTSQIQQQQSPQAPDYSLADWMDDLNQKSLAEFGKSLRIALEPQQQIIGKRVYELAFLYDPDGCLVELLNHQSSLTNPVSSGWEAWSGDDFVGPSLDDQPPPIEDW